MTRWFGSPEPYAFALHKDDTKQLLDLAARLALRARGYAEPNPLVGAVIVKDGEIIGRGHHCRYGGLHAEAEALADSRGRGIDPSGSTMYVTLEPCDHFGKQPPCSKAIIDARIARVVIARSDPNPVSSGGAETLRRAGVAVEFSDESELAIRLSDAFIKRITTGLPRVIAKWAQTPGGRMISPPNEARWISNELSRRRVHRLRARMDAVITGIGTVEADNPLLTTRDVKIRRVARRVVLDSSLRIRYDSALIGSAKAGPVHIFCDAERLGKDSEMKSKSIVLASAGVTVQGIPRSGEGLELRAAVESLAAQFEATNVMIEAGPRLLKGFVDAGLVDELIVYIGGAPVGFGASTFPGFALARSKPVGDDLELSYRRDG